MWGGGGGGVQVPFRRRLFIACHSWCRGCLLSGIADVASSRLLLPPGIHSGEQWQEEEKNKGSLTEIN